MSTLSKTQPDTSAKDHRFNSPRFRKAVRSVLEYLGFEPTFTNFREIDAVVNWTEFESNILAREEATRINAGGEPVKHGYTPVLWNKIREYLED